VREHGHRLVHDLPRQKVEKIIGKIGETKPSMANLTRSVLQHKLMVFAVKNNWRGDNPVAGVESFTIGTHHTWADDDLAAYEARWPLGTRERRAYALLLETGQRGGDVVKMSRTDISRGRISVVQEKTGTALLIPIIPALHAALKAGPNNGLRLIGDEHGRPMKRQAITDLIKRAAKEAGLPPHCKAHGLPKARMRRLAEQGASTKVICINLWAQDAQGGRTVHRRGGAGGCCRSGSV
jgi:site-specific recombinase XerD